LPHHRSLLPRHRSLLPYSRSAQACSVVYPVTI
jgi:hypothetical protein